MSDRSERTVDENSYGLIKVIWKHLHLHLPGDWRSPWKLQSGYVVPQLKLEPSTSWIQAYSITAIPTHSMVRWRWDTWRQYIPPKHWYLLLDYMVSHSRRPFKMSYVISYLVTIDGIIGLIMVPWCSFLSSWFFIQHMLMVKFDPLKHPQVWW